MKVTDAGWQGDVKDGSKRPRVVIVGGGFGGIEAAKALAKAPVDVTLIDRANYHLFQPLLYQVAMAGLSPAEIAEPIRAILAKQANARVVLGEVTEIDLERRTVFAGEAGLYGYDWLILALGARTTYFGNDGWEKNAPGLKSIEDAVEIRRRVLTAFERAERLSDPHARRKLLTFVVIGGGPTGVEMAGAIAELSRFVLSRDFRSIDPRETKVVLVEAGPRILPTFAQSLSDRAVDQLEELGVEVQTSTKVVTIDEDGAELEDATPDANDLPGLGDGPARTRIEAATVLWGAGVAANDLTRSLGSGVPLDRQGRIVVGQDCALPGHPEVFAIGDVAHFDDGGKPLPGVSPVAMQQGRYVARLIREEQRATFDRETLRPDLASAKREPFQYFDKGSMATIGRSRAIAEARGIRMSGMLAWLAWLFIHVFYLIGFRSRLVVLFTWAWSYVSYKRGARLITATGWMPKDAAHRAEGQAPPPSRPPTSKRRRDGEERALPEAVRAP